MPKLHFDITGDNSNIANVIEDTQQRFQNLAKTMKKVSGETDMSIDGPVKQIAALKVAINNNIGAIKAYGRELKTLERDLREASAAGDTDRVAILNQRVDEVRDKLAAAKENVEEYKGAMESLTGATSENVGIMTKLLGGTENYNKIISMLPPGMRMVVGELNGMVGAARAFIATPIGAVVAALALAFSSLKTFLSGAADGQREFAEVSGYVSGVIAKLKDYVIQFGRELYSAFKDNLPYIKDFATRVGGLIKVFSGLFGIVQSGFKGMFSKDWSEFDAKTKKIGEGFNQISTGKNNNQQLDQLDDVGKKTAALAKQEWDLNVQRKKWSVEEAKLDEKIAEARTKMMSASTSERQRYAKELKALNDKKYEKQIQFAEEELRITKERNALSENTQEDYNREYELEARIYQLRAQQKSASGRADRIEASTGRTYAAADSQEQQRRLEMFEAFNKQRSQLERDGDALLIAGMKEGFEKEKRELDYEHQARLEKISEEYNDQVNRIKKLQEEAYKRTHDGSLSGFVFNQNDALLEEAKKNQDQQIKNEDQRDANARAANLKKYLDEYKSFTKKWEEQTAKFADTRAFLEAANAADDTIDALNNKERDSLTALAKQWATSGWDEDFKTWMENLAGQSLLDLHVMMNDLEGDIAIFGDMLPTEQVDQLRAKVLLLKDAIRNFKEEKLDPDKFRTNWADLNKVLAGSAKVFNQVGDAIGGTFGDALSMLGSFAASVGQVGLSIERIKEISKKGNPLEIFTAGLSAASAAMSIIGGLYSKIKESVEQTKQLDLATRAYSRTLKSIRESRLLEAYDTVFGKDDFGKFMKQFDIAKEARVSLNAAIKEFSDNSFSVFGDLLGDTFVIHSDMRTGWQKFWGSQKNIFSVLMSDFIDEEGNLMGEELREWVKTYGEGLSTETRDSVDKILGEWDRLQEAENGVKNFLSTMFDNVADDVADKMLDKFIQTGDAILDMTEYMDNFGQSVAKSIVKGQLIDKVFNDKARNDIASLLSNGDEGSVAKAIEMYNDLLKQANEQAPAIQKFLEGAHLGEGAYNESGTTGSFSGMSQEMGSALEGRFTAVQIATETIAERMLTNMAVMTAMSNYMAGSNTTLSEIRDAHVREVGYLEDIARQTRPLSNLVAVGDKLDIIASKL